MFMSNARSLRWGIVGAMSLGLLVSCGGAETGSDGGTADTIAPGTDFVITRIWRNIRKKTVVEASISQVFLQLQHKRQVAAAFVRNDQRV